MHGFFFSSFSIDLFFFFWVVLGFCHILLVVRILFSSLNTLFFFFWDIRSVYVEGGKTWASSELSRFLLIDHTHLSQRGKMVSISASREHATS